MPASAVRPRSRVAAPPKPTPVSAPTEAAITRMLAHPTPAAHPDEASPALIAMLAEWKALLEQINSGGISDAEVDRLAPRHDALQMAIYAYPAASVADLAAKVPVFEDELRDAVDGLHEDFQPRDTKAGAAWLGLFRDFERLASGPVLQPARIPVAEPDPIFAAIQARAAACAAFDAWEEARGRRRLTTAQRAEEDTLSAASLAAYRRMLSTVPTTVAGRLALLDRLQVEMDLHGMANGDPPEAESLFWPEFFGALRGALGNGGLPDVGLAAALRERRAKANAFLDQMQREGFVPHPAHDPRSLMSIDLAIPLEAKRLLSIAQAEFDRLADAYVNFPPAERETHLRRMRAEYRLDEFAAVVHGADASPQLSLVDQIIATWREWAALPANDESPEGEAAYERLSARRYALMDAAEELPATLENLPAKALALAWIEYVDLWSNGQSRDDYATDGRLALDIDTAILGRLRTEY